MADFVRDVIDPESVANGRIDAGFAKSFAAGDTGNTNASKTATRGAEDVADVIICVPNDEVEIGLVLRDQEAWIIAGVRIGACVGIDD
jgi:hypothetical protein